MKKIILSLTFIVLSCGILNAKDDSLFEKRGVILEDGVPYTSTTEATAYGALRFFQIFISPVDSSRCAFRPTCSQYAKECVKEHGIIKAFPLIFARLIRCNPSAYYNKEYERVNNDPFAKPYDPVR